MNMDDKKREELLTNDDSFFSKALRVGAVLFIGGKVAKSISPEVFKKVANNELLRSTAIVGSTYLLSQDDDRLEDTMVASSLIFGSSATKALKYSLMVNSADSSVVKAFRKIDDFQTSLKYFSLDKREYMSQFGERAYEVMGDREGIKDMLMDIPKIIAHEASFIKKAWNDNDRSVTKTLMAISDNDMRREFFEIRDASHGTAVNGFGNEFAAPVLSDYESDYLSKIKTIEKNRTFFTDMLGNYKQVDTNGNVTINYKKMMDDGSSNLYSLNNMAKAYIDKMGITKSEATEEGFVNFLRGVGAGEVVDSFYKGSNFTVSEAVDRGLLEQLDEYARENKHFYKDNIGRIPETSSERPQDYIKYYDIIKNFSLNTDLSIASDGKTVLDDTVLSGDMLRYKALNLLENTARASYSVSFGFLEKLNFMGGDTKKLQDHLWRPFKMIQSEKRMKQDIYNKGFFATQDNLFVDGGNRINFKRSGSGKKDNMEIVNMGKGHRVNLTSLDILDPSIEHSVYEGYNNATAKDIFGPGKGGVKERFERFSKSQYNPFAFRYESGSGFRKVSTKDDYFVSGDARDILFPKKTKEMYEDVEKVDEAITKKLTIWYEKMFKNINPEAHLDGYRGETQAEFVENFERGLRRAQFDKEFGNKKVYDEARKLQDNFGDLDELDKIFIEGTADKARELFGTKVDGDFIARYIGVTRGKGGGFERIDYIDDMIDMFQIKIDDGLTPLTKVRDDMTLVRKMIEAKRYGINNADYHFENNIDKLGSDKLADFVLENKDRYLKNLELSHSSYSYYKFSQEDIFKQNGFENLGHFSSKTNKDFSEWERSTGKDDDLDFDVTDITGSFKRAFREIAGIEDKVETDAFEYEKYFEHNISEIEKNPSLDNLRDSRYTGTRDQEDKIKRMTFVQDPLAYIFEAKGVLEKVKKMVEVFSGKTPNETYFSLMMRIPIAKLEEAFEFIGIKRLDLKPYKTIETANGDQHVYENFWKYYSEFGTKRLLPLMVAGSALYSANAAVDVALPDETPIFGEGVVAGAAKTLAAARIGMQYAFEFTGLLGGMQKLESMFPGLVENSITAWADPLMDPEEMKEVYFDGKPIRINKNRFWFTAGRQSAMGEEFGQFRPHMLYGLQHRTAGIYDNKAEKFFRKDFAPTSALWYTLDPYKEEREAYENYGLKYAKTEELFKDIPVVGHLLSATVGQIIKPSRYMWEDEWRAGDNLMINPDYNPKDPASMPYIEFNEPNKLVKGLFEAIEDLKTFSGLQGYFLTKGTQLIFGQSTPYSNDVSLEGFDDDYNIANRYNDFQLGGMFGLTEPIRRIIDDHDATGEFVMNPVKNELPDWIPDFLKNKNPYADYALGEFIAPGSTYERHFGLHGEDRTYGALDKHRILSMIAPGSVEYNQAAREVESLMSSLNRKDRIFASQSFSYADEYGERIFRSRVYDNIATEKRTVSVDKVLDFNEFMSDGKRYKLIGMEDDFNKLSQRIGGEAALREIDRMKDELSRSKNLTVKIASDPISSVRTDDQGEYFEVYSKELTRRTMAKPHNLSTGVFSSLVGKTYEAYRNLPGKMEKEKLFGVKDPLEEWYYETVAAPYFRDWDDPIVSFVEPLFNISSSSIPGAFAMGSVARGLDSGNLLPVYQSITAAGTVAGMFGDFESTAYTKETEVLDELEKNIYAKTGKGFYALRGTERISTLQKHLNASDAEFFEQLVNEDDPNRRERILEVANNRMATSLKMVWDRQNKYANEEVTYGKQKPTFESYEELENFSYDKTFNKLQLRKALGHSFTKLEARQAALLKAYRGDEAFGQAQYLESKMYERYNSPNVRLTSTIFDGGKINITEENN